jgi:hypothetical protein
MIGGTSRQLVADLSLLHCSLLKRVAANNSGLSANNFAVISQADTSEVAGILRESLSCSLFFCCK